MNRPTTGIICTSPTSARFSYDFVRSKISQLMAAVCNAKALKAGQALGASAAQSVATNSVSGRLFFILHCASVCGRETFLEALCGSAVRRHGRNLGSVLSGGADIGREGSASAA